MTRDPFVQHARVGASVDDEIPFFKCTERSSYHHKVTTVDIERNLVLMHGKRFCPAKRSVQEKNTNTRAKCTVPHCFWPRCPRRDVKGGHLVHALCVYSRGLA